MSDLIAFVGTAALEGLTGAVLVGLGFRVAFERR